MFFGLTDTTAATVLVSVAVVVVTAADIHRGEERAAKGQVCATLSCCSRACYANEPQLCVSARYSYTSECTCPSAAWLLFAPPPPPAPAPHPTLALLLPFSLIRPTTAHSIQAAGALNSFTSKTKRPQEEKGAGGRRQRRRRKQLSRAPDWRVGRMMR